MATTVYLALGSNLGDRRGFLQSALDEMLRFDGFDFDPHVDASSVYETSPVGFDDDASSFLNMVVRVSTSIEPYDLLAWIHDVESRYGRQRGDGCLSRTLDIDIVLYGQRIISDAKLTIPHPHMCKRLFVLEPLLEVSPDLVDPHSCESFAMIKQLLLQCGTSQAIHRVDQQCQIPSEDTDDVILLNRHIKTINVSPI